MERYILDKNEKKELMCYITSRNELEKLGSEETEKISLYITSGIKKFEFYDYNKNLIREHDLSIMVKKHLYERKNFICEVAVTTWTKTLFTHKQRMDLFNSEKFKIKGSSLAFHLRTKKKEKTNILLYNHAFNIISIEGKNKFYIGQSWFGLQPYHFFTIKEEPYEFLKNYLKNLQYYNNKLWNSLDSKYNEKTENYIKNIGYVLVDFINETKQPIYNVIQIRSRDLLMS